MARLQPAAEAALFASPDDTEHQFYESLQRGDIDKLMAVWADDEDITCVHPGGPRLVGAAMIRATFDSMLVEGAMEVFPEKVRRVQTQTCAIHSVLERLQAQGPEGATHTVWVVATNVYLKGTHGWRLVAHHASPGSPNELQEIGEAPSTLH